MGLLFDFYDITSPPTGLPLGLTRYYVYWGPEGGPSDTYWYNNGYGGNDPNTDNWEYGDSDTGLGSLSKTTFASSWRMPGYQIPGVDAEFAVVVDPFRSKVLDRCKEGASNVTSAYGNVVPADLSITKTEWSAEWSGSDPGGAPYAAGKGYWVESESSSTTDTGDMTIALMGLYRPASGSTLVCKIIATSDNPATAEDGETCGMVMTNLVKGYLNERDKAVAFMLIAMPNKGWASNPITDPIDITSEDGRKKMWECLHDEDFVWEEDTDSKWWKIGSATFWEYEWTSLSISGGIVNFSSNPGLDTNMRAQPGLIPSFA